MPAKKNGGALGRVAGGTREGRREEYCKAAGKQLQSEFGAARKLYNRRMRNRYIMASELASAKP